MSLSVLSFVSLEDHVLSACSSAVAFEAQLVDRLLALTANSSNSYELLPTSGET